MQVLWRSQKYECPTQHSSSNKNNMTASFMRIQISCDANFTIFTSRIFTSSTIRSWTDNDESAVDCMSRSISARLSMKCFPHCTRLDYIIVFIIIKKHFHKGHRVPNWCRHPDTYKQWPSWQITFPRCEVYNEISKMNYEKMYFKNA